LFIVKLMSDYHFKDFKKIQDGSNKINGYYLKKTLNFC